VKAHQSKPQHGQSQLSDEAKFKVVSDIFNAVEKLLHLSVSVSPSHCFETVGARCNLIPLRSVLRQFLHPESSVQVSPVGDVSFLPSTAAYRSLLMSRLSCVQRMCLRSCNMLLLVMFLSDTSNISNRI